MSLTGTESLYVVFIVVTALVSVSILVFLRHRDNDIVKSRLPYISAAVATSFCVSALEVCLSNLVSPYPCAIRKLAILSLGGGPATGYLLRAFQLWFKFGLANEQINQAHSSEPVKLKFAPYAKYCKLDFLYKVFSSALLGYTVLFIISAVLSWGEEKEASSQVYCDSNIIQWIAVVFVIAEVMAIMFLAVRMQDTFDSFGIKKELKLVAVVGMIGVLLVGILELFTDVDSGIVLTLAPLICAAVTCIHPLWSIRTANRRENIVHATPRASTINGKSYNELVAILDTVEGLAAFERHLISELSVENLVFYREYNRLRIKSRSEANLEWTKIELRSIIDTFVTSGSDMEVNIHVKFRRPIAPALEVMDDSPDGVEHVLELMDKIEEEVLTLMYKDSFPRFASTDAYLAVQKLIMGKRAALEI